MAELQNFFHNSAIFFPLAVVRKDHPRKFSPDALSMVCFPDFQKVS